MDDRFLLIRQLMVDEQLRPRGIKQLNVLEAMLEVPRHAFVPKDELEWAYKDAPLPIGCGQTISQPYIVALMTELLQIESCDRVLEVGTGSGYQAAILGQLADKVHTVEIIPELYQRAKEALNGLGYKNIHIHLSDGSLGWVDGAPYDGILVAACAPSVPACLFDQLADGGKLVIPVGSKGYQQLEVWERQNEQLFRTINIAVSFVPLRGKFGWR